MDQGPGRGPPPLCSLCFLWRLVISFFFTSLAAAAAVATSAKDKAESPAFVFNGSFRTDKYLFRFRTMSLELGFKETNPPTGHSKRRAIR